MVLSTDVAVGDQILATQHNNLRTDALNAYSAGKQRRYFPVSMMYPGGVGANPATNGLVESYFPVLLFDPTTNEEALLSWVFPKKYDGGDIKLRLYGIQSGTDTGDVVISVYLESTANGNSPSGAPAGIYITITMPGADNKVFASDWTTALGGSKLNAEELAYFIFRRQATHVDDDYAADFQLTGVEIEYTTNAENDE